ncbi:MAG: RNA polymerase sigma factor [Betaproteobacteria bacterium]|nr:RNA polymerase sigma factor [Betaproteobacteria bacterium]
MNLGIENLFGRGPALRREIERERGMLCRMAYAWCHDAALADDLAQMAVEKALRAAGQLRDPDKLKAWMLQILSNCLKDHLRDKRDLVDFESVEETLATGEPTPEEARAGAELVRSVRAAVAALPVGQRQVVTLVDLEECTYAEAGDILEIPVGTVMSRLCRARRALRDALEPVAREALGTRLRSVK